MFIAPYSIRLYCNSSIWENYSHFCQINVVFSRHMHYYKSFCILSVIVQSLIRLCKTLNLCWLVCGMHTIQSNESWLIRNGIRCTKRAPMISSLLHPDSLILRQSTYQHNARNRSGRPMTLDSVYSMKLSWETYFIRVWCVYCINSRDKDL